MRVERITDEHDVGGFGCVVKPLDDWLQNHAVDSDRRNLSRTFVVVDGDEVIGYYSLAIGGVHRDELPRRFGRGLPGYSIGMVLLARLAIATDRQGEGLGRDLLVEAIERAALAGQQAAARFVVVDPIDERARSFYRAFGFREVPGDDGGRMFVRIDEALAALGSA
jgi:predicted N-acetyltransferase YhbS